MKRVTIGDRSMCTLLFRAAPIVFASILGSQPAYADIYTWIDDSGSINVSNLTPPEGVRITKTVRESAPRIVARTDPASDSARQGEVQALAERVRQLETELAVSQSQISPLAAYSPAPPAPVIQYFIDAGSTQVQYNSVGQSGCGAAWTDCGAGWNSGFFPAGIVFIPAPNFRRLPPRAGQPAPRHPPMYGGWASRRG